MQPINRRNFVAQLGAGATAATWMANSALAGTPSPAPSPAHGPISHEQCIENCRKCQQICHETIQYCLSKGGAHVNAEHLALLMSCAEICGTSAAFMTNKSEFSPLVCGVCAQVCQACADSCAKLDKDSAQMQTCVVACNTCVKSCKQMAEGHHH